VKYLHNISCIFNNISTATWQIVEFFTNDAIV
jgi:hypothetical protein